MSRTKERVIKPTADGRFHAMGLVVDTFDEAIERCKKKGNTNNYFLVYPVVEVLGMSTQAEVCGTPEYLRQFIDSTET